MPSALITLSTAYDNTCAIQNALDQILKERLIAYQ